MRSKAPSLRRRARASSPIASFAGARARSALGELPSALPLPQRKLAAILAADVEGYSRLMHENEEAALTTLSCHRAIIDGHSRPMDEHLNSSSRARASALKRPATGASSSRLRGSRNARGLAVRTRRRERVRSPRCPRSLFRPALGPFRTTNVPRMSRGSPRAPKLTGGTCP